MKKIYLTLGLALSVAGAFAQINASKVLTPNTPKSLTLSNESQAAKTAVTSTLMPATFNTGGCATNTANISYYSTFGGQANSTYTVEATGYAFGTNNTTYTLSAAIAGAIGTPTITDVSNIAAQKYNVSGNVSVTEILFATAIGEGSTGVATAKVYSENTTTKAPNTQLGSSSTMALSALTGYDAITFASPIPVSTGNFFAAIQAPVMGGAGQDTLAILSTVVGCSSTDSLSWSYHTVSPPSAAAVGLSSKWMSVNADFGGNLDLLIFPVVDITTGLNNSISKGNLTLLAAFPNPATNDVTINFGLNQSSKVEIEIYDVTGKMVNSIKLDNLEAGNHSSKINTSNLNSGVYMYSVKSDNAKMFSKFTVAK